jgi:flagellin-like protein
MKRSNRAQSEVIGVVLLLGLTITAVGVTVALGSAAVSDVQSSADVQRIEGAMTQVDSKASLVAHGGSTSQRVRLDPSRNADVRVDDEAGVMRIEVEAENGTGDVETVTRNVTLGAIVYEQGDERVAYQGGGVWRSNGDGSWMVSPPEFHYRGDTLTLPLVTIDGADGRLGDAAIITGRSEHPEGLFPAENVSNPLLGGNVTVTVESEYAQAWGQFFETRTQGNVTRLSPTEVQVALRTKTVHPTLSASVSALGNSRLEFGGIKTLYADSYDSSSGSYPGKGNASDNAVIQTTSDFHLTSGGGGKTESIEIRGDLIAESIKAPKGQAKKKLTVTGEQRVDDSLESADPIAGAISQRIQQIRGQDLQSGGVTTAGFAHDDGTVHIIDQDTFVDGDITVSDGSTLRVEDEATVQIAGSLDVSEDGRVEFESDDGDLAALVEGDVSMRDQAILRARGGNHGELFVDGAVEIRDDASITAASDTRFELYNTGDVDVTDRARIAADGDVAGNLWLYSSGENIRFQGAPSDGIDFAGVMYAPTSDVTLENEMTFKGSFTSGSFEFSDADLTLHYDESLATLQPFEGDSVPVVSHLHISRHRVTVEGD